MQKRKLIFSGLIAIFLLFLIAYLLYHPLSRGYSFKIIDYFSGGEPVLRWTKFGFPVLTLWRVSSNKRIKILFYRVSLPELELTSPEIVFPVTLKKQSVVPLIVVRKEWFPAILNRFKAGDKFYAVIELIVRKDRHFYKIKRKVPIFYSGKVINLKEENK